MSDQIKRNSRNTPRRRNFQSDVQDCLNILDRHHEEMHVPEKRSAGRPARKPLNRNGQPPRRKTAAPERPENRRPAGRNVCRVSAEVSGMKRKKQQYRKYNKVFQAVNASVCALLLFGIGLFLLIAKRQHGFIDSENRNRAEFPSFSVGSYFSGDYTDGIVRYYTDTIPGREKMRSAANRITAHFGFQKDDVSFYGNTVQLEKETLSEDDSAVTSKVTVYIATRTTTTTTDTETTSVSSEDQSSESSGSGTSSTTSATTGETTTTTAMTTKVRTQMADEGEILNNIIVSGRGTPNVRAMPMFGGRFDIGKRYAEVLNKYKEMVGPTVNVYNLSAPLSSAFYMPSNLANKFSDQHDCIKNIGNNLKDVINVDVFDTLESHKDEYIYYRTDHHWSTLGAYYAAQKFAEEAAVPFADLSTYEKKQTDNFCGTMYGYTKYLEDLKTYPDTYYYYKPSNQYSVRYFNDSFQKPQESTLFFEWAKGVNCYSTVLGGDKNIAEITTDVGNGRTLVIIKNSYGNALVPYFVGSFEKIYVVDFRYVKVGMKDFFKQIGATDVLFGMAISSCYTNQHINAIEEIMK